MSKYKVELMVLAEVYVNAPSINSAVQRARQLVQGHARVMPTAFTLSCEEIKNDEKQIDPCA